MQPILIQRFLIHLRYIDHDENTSEIDHFSRFTAPRFRTPPMSSIIGNLGEPLDLTNGPGSTHNDNDAIYEEVPNCEEDSVTEEFEQDMDQGHTAADTFHEVCRLSSSAFE